MLYFFFVRNDIFLRSVNFNSVFNHVSFSFFTSTLRDSCVVSLPACPFRVPQSSCRLTRMLHDVCAFTTTLSIFTVCIGPQPEPKYRLPHSMIFFCCRYYQTMNSYSLVFVASAIQLKVHIVCVGTTAVVHIARNDVGCNQSTLPTCTAVCTAVFLYLTCYCNSSVSLFETSNSFLLAVMTPTVTK